MRDRLAKLFPVWDRLDESERASVASNTVLKRFDAGSHVHSGSNDCIGVIIVVAGTLRSYILSDEGREISLFKATPGETCVLSASCILPLIDFQVFIDAWTDTDLLIISPKCYDALMKTNPYVEAFTYRQTCERFSEVMWVMQQVLFVSFDRRLAGYLIGEYEATGSTVLPVTHDHIARELGSAREVVSRMLKYFERDGLVKLSRGTIALTDLPRLKALRG